MTIEWGNASWGLKMVKSEGFYEWAKTDEAVAVLFLKLV